MSPQNPLDYLDSLSQHTVKPGLERISNILNAAGNPHLSPNTVVIAGTNGKTSTASMLSEILISCGFTTGLYTSPHLVRVGERIKINGKPISDSYLGNLIDRVRIISGDGKIKASYFETVTAAAFISFHEKNVDFAVMETGMGGRWDAVNAARPTVCAITNVSMDHIQYLGDTPEKIAAEKAGIAKKKVPLVTAAEGNALKVIEKKCSEKKTPLLKIKRDFNCLQTAREVFSYSGRSWNIKNIRLGMAGGFQIKNACLALACAEIISGRGFDINPEQAKQALEKTRVGARMEYTRVSPPLIIDGAHNSESARCLTLSIMENHPSEKFVFIIAMSNDKNPKEFFKHIEPVCRRLILTRSQSLKGERPETLMKLAPVSIEAEIAETTEEALKTALKTALPCCVTGSLYFAGDVKKLFENGSIKI